MALNIEALLERNKATSETHEPIPTLNDILASGKPAFKTMIVTCLDPRCIPEKFFNLQTGEALVHRNIGGNARHALKDILFLDAFIGLDELAIIHHTDCGMLRAGEAQIREVVKERSGMDASHFGEVDAMTFGAFAEIEQSVKDDVAWVKGNPMIRDELKKGCQGFVFDIKTGKVEKV